MLSLHLQWITPDILSKECYNLKHVRYFRMAAPTLPQIHESGLARAWSHDAVFVSSSYGLSYASGSKVL